MEKQSVPNLFVLVTSIQKRKTGEMEKRAAIYLDKDVVLPGGSSDFNDLEHRPSYKGTVMDGNTNIPEVKKLHCG